MIVVLWVGAFSIVVFIACLVSFLIRSKEAGCFTETLVAYEELAV